MKNIILCKCNAQTRYECGGLGRSRCEYSVIGHEYSMALCESRHEIPQAEDGAIFPQEIEDPMNFFRLRTLCREKLGPLVGTCDVLNVYVTGLTPALLTVVNFCRENKIECVTWHFNRATGEYKPLPMY